MAEGELGAVFKGLAEDAGQAAGDIAESMARFTETTADTEDGNVARTLAADAETAKSAATIGKGAGSLGPGAGWTGARYIEASSPEAEAAYTAIRENPADVPRIAENTGISQDVIGEVKAHLFLTEHDVPVGPDQVLRGYFTPDDQIASLWNKAEAGTLSPAERNGFRSLMAHEYVEKRLMEAGLPYRSADPQAWEDGDQIFNPPHVGAHEIAPLAHNGLLVHWPMLGLTAPAAPIAPDLSNIDEVVNAAREGLKL